MVEVTFPPHVKDEEVINVAASVAASVGVTPEVVKDISLPYTLTVLFMAYAFT